MSFLDNLRTKIASRLLGVSTSQGWTQPITMEILKGIVTWAGQNADSFVNNGYSENDIVYSIVNLITTKAKVATWGAYKVVDEKKYYQYKAALDTQVKDWKKILELKEQSLEPYKNDDRLNELLKYPNEQDTWSDLVEAHCGYKLITGNAYLQAPLIEAGKNTGKPLILSPLPSQYMSIIAQVGRIPAIVEGYQLYLGTYYKFTKEQLLS